VKRTDLLPLLFLPTPSIPEVKNKSQKRGKFSTLKIVLLRTSIVTSITTSSPQKNHVKDVVFSKTPSKTHKHQPKKNY